MNRKLKKAVSLAAVVWLLTGCGQEPNVYYPLKENTENRITSIEKSSRRAPSMTLDLCVVTGTEAEPDSSVIAEAAGVFSESDQTVILQKNVYERLYPASVTKIMTALLAVKYGDLSDSVTVGQETVIMESGASMANIRPGDTLTMEQLLYGLMLPSGNDAGAAIAVHMAGSMEAFADMMNQEARMLGATGTHFVNAHGLSDPEHYTTAYDLYLIFHEALKYPKFREIIHTASYDAQYTDGNGGTVAQTWKNSNKYLNGEREMPEGLTIIGGKTGTTKAAGYCLLMASKDDSGDDYISIIMKSDSRDHLYDSMTTIIQKIYN